MGPSWSTGNERPSISRHGGPYVMEGQSKVSSENWHEERDRLVRLLKAIETGKASHIDEDGLRELQAINPENIAALKKRLADLNARLGYGDR